MSRSRGSDDDEDNFDRQSPPPRTQRFTKSGAFASNDFKTTPSRPKANEVSNLKLDLNQSNDDDTSDEDTNTKTGRSTSSATTSQLTPKPKERSFLRGNLDKPKVQSRHFVDDDDDRNVFGQTTMKPSPRYQISSIKEDKQRDQSFVDSFRNEKERQSPKDMFSNDQRSDFRRNSRKSPSDHEEHKHHDSDDEPFTNKYTKGNNLHKARHSPTDSDKSQSRKNSSRSKEDMDHSDPDDNEYGNTKSKQQDYIKKRQSNHDLAQTSPKASDSHVVEHQSSSSRPGSAGRKEMESSRRSSYCEDKDTVIPPTTNPNSESRPTSAKSNTTRQQTQSAIDNVTSANAPLALDPLMSNNEALADTLRSSSPPIPPPRPSAKLPPKPKSNHTTTTGGTRNKKAKFAVPSRYKDITSCVDTGRKSVVDIDLKKSIDREINKALKSQTLPRPQSSRARKQSANSTGSQRRRSSSAYEHVQPRVNTNRSINFEELNTSQMRADSSQSIKDGVYFEWLKAKEEQRRFEQEELKRQEKETTKLVDKTQIERKVQQNAQNLVKWRQEKDEELKRKKREERELQREEMQNKKQEQQKKTKDAKDGFKNWEEKKFEELARQKAEVEQREKVEIEKRQTEKQAKFLESQKKFDEWKEEKDKQLKEGHKARKTARNDQLKTIQQAEETKFVTAQEAYENWLKDKEKYEIEENATAKRRNSRSAQQPQAPFLPGGGPKNSGKVRHVVW